MTEDFDLAIHRYTTARGYVITLHLVQVGKGALGPDAAEKLLPGTILAMSQLAGFALELYGKAWLLGHGLDPETVRKYNHNITKIYEDAEKHGMVLSDNIRQLIAAFVSGHKDFTFRYIEAEVSVNTINWQIAFAVFSELDQIVDEKVGGSKKFGLPTGRPFL